MITDGDDNDSAVDSKAIDDVPKERIVSLREAAAKQLLTGGQGYKKCNCRASAKQCSTNRCNCYKSGVLCSFRCHLSGPCTNK